MLLRQGYDVLFHVPCIEIYNQTLTDFSTHVLNKLGSQNNRNGWAISHCPLIRSRSLHYLRQSSFRFTELSSSNCKSLTKYTRYQKTLSLDSIVAAADQNIQASDSILSVVTIKITCLWERVGDTRGQNCRYQSHQLARYQSHQLAIFPSSPFYCKALAKVARKVANGKLIADISASQLRKIWVHLGGPWEGKGIPSL